jgi:trehalose 6-phosphate phosphatase
MAVTGAPVDAFRRDPGRAGLFIDFDGTLSPIVLDPESARPLPGAVEVLVDLRSRLARVVVVSGRPVAFLARHLPDEIDLVGLYGLESRRAGQVVEHPEAARWRPVVDRVVAQAVDELPTRVEVEHKGLSLTLHVRRHPEVAEAADAWATAAAAASGLLLRPAKHSVELHPPVAADKGTVVDELVAGLAVAAYVGDDSGDLPAFAALDRFAAAGGTALRVVVSTDETPPELLAAADLLVEGPEGVVELLRDLGGTAPGAPSG